MPRPRFLEAFELTLKERMELAGVYAYGSRLDLLADGRELSTSARFPTP